MAKQSVQFKGKSIDDVIGLHDHAAEERKTLPHAHISHPDLPDLKPGQVVHLKAKVKTFGSNKSATGDGTKIDRHAGLDIHELTPGEMENDGPESKASDEDEIEKGLSAAEQGDDDE
jgi:hypothetical protein